MVKQGRPAKPEAVKALEGSEHAGKGKDLELREGEVVPPFPLSEVGTRIWDALIEWAPEGLITPYDALALWQFCNAWEDYQVACGLVEEHGAIAISPKGGAYMHPAMSLKANAFNRIKTIGALFGWSPSDRVGLYLQPDKQSPSEQLFEMLTRGGSK